MDSNLSESVEISIAKSACLILYELLAASYEKWRAANPEDVTAGPMLLTAENHAERMALWKLEGALERTVPELFSSNYEELLDQSRELLKL